jgi:formiminotetrahydrofolate cyclodeaminase
VAGACARTAAEGAALNVRINAASITDAGERDRLLSRQAAALAQAHTLADAVRAAVEARLTPGQ